MVIIKYNKCKKCKLKNRNQNTYPCTKCKEDSIDPPITCHDCRQWGYGDQCKKGILPCKEFKWW